MKKQMYMSVEKIHKQKKIKKIVKLSLLILLLLLIVLYLILRVIYEEGRFTVTLDYNKDLQSGLAIYESINDPVGKLQLQAGKIEFLDNIAMSWLPEDIHEQSEGSHNGDNYIAYTFYVENQGVEVQNYWYEFVMKDVIKEVDDAVRIMVYLNGEKTVYAKKSNITGEAEEGTIPFRLDNPIVSEKRENFKPGDRDKFTIVIWLEGPDPDCVDSIIGGELKLEMNITDEHIMERGE